MDNKHNISSKPDVTDVASMFDSIAWRYDFLNHFLSFNIDRQWRKRVVNIIAKHHSFSEILDVATGTCDLAILSAKLNPSRITGIDISGKMLEIGRRKVIRKGLSDLIELVKCDSENICFRDNSFDVAMVAFGVRNFTDPLRGLKEMTRVLRSGGLLIVLEFSKPEGFLFKRIYNFYFSKLLPFLGKVLSKDKLAYRYLNESVMRFPDNDEFLQIMRSAGLSDLNQLKLTAGIASIYTGVKNQEQ
jgi:demethylmenaquinone methyltransferase/2-methoxy-6-polyprenyl-1,4-benzoquinol methylase